MIFWKFCRVSRLKEVYQRLPLLSSINQINKISQRCHTNIQSQIFLMGSSKKMKKFMSLDKVPEDSKLVYNCSISKIVTLAYNGSYFLTIFILAGIYYFKDHELEYPLYEPSKDDSNRRMITIYSEVEHFLIYSFLLCYNIFGFLCCRRTALRIWYNPSSKKYCMILPNFLAQKVRKVTVNPGDMSIKYGYKSLPLIRNIHVMNGWRYYINEDNFITAADYMKFIGKF